MAAEIANQAEIFFARHARHRPVVMDARDRLHAPAIALTQTHAVDALQAADIRFAIAAERDCLVGGQSARHAVDPQALCLNGCAQRLIHRLVQLGQLLQAGLDPGMHAGDQLDLRLAIVGGDMRMRQRRTQRQRVWCQRQHAVGQRTQAFLFDAAANPAQLRTGECAHALGTVAHVGVPLLSTRDSNRVRRPLHVWGHKHPSQGFRQRPAWPGSRAVWRRAGGACSPVAAWPAAPGYCFARPHRRSASPALRRR